MDVYIVDDDVEDTEIFCDALLSLDSSFRCSIIHDGYKALDLFKKMDTPPDYIFLDANLIRISGRDCLVELRAMESLTDTCIVIYSGALSDQMKNEFLGLGANYVVTKPGSLSGLREMLLKIIR